MKNLYILLLLTFGLGQDYSLQFDGVNDYVEAGSNIDLTNSAFSIEVWYKKPLSTHWDATNIITNYGTSTSSSPNSWSLEIQGFAGGDSHVGRVSFGHEYSSVESTERIDDGNWHHLAIERFSDGALKLFVDGQLNDTDSLDLSTNIYTGYNLFIGSRVYNRFVECSISEVIISKQNTYYDLFVPPSNFTTNSQTVLHLKMNEGDGTTLADQSSYENNGIIFGGATWSTDVPTVGCTDPVADNYDETANVDDGSCTGSPVDSSAFTYAGELDGHYYYLSNNTANWENAKIISEDNYGHLAIIADENENNFIANLLSDIEVWIGLYQNLNSSSYTEPNEGWEWVDGVPLDYLGDNNWSLYQNWAYHPGSDFWSPNNNGNEDFALMGSGTGVWDDKNASYETYYILEMDYVPVLGCTHPNATNYDETANVDDGSCLYVGCTNPAACNYNADATEDDDSCLYYDCAAECGGSAVVDECGVCEGDNSSCGGCTDVNAQNYDEEALIDDGSCIYLPEISITPDSLHFDMVVYENTILTNPLTIFNNGWGNLYWEIPNLMNLDTIWQNRRDLVTIEFCGVINGCTAEINDFDYMYFGPINGSSSVYFSGDGGYHSHLSNFSISIQLLDINVNWNEIYQANYSSPGHTYFSDIGTIDFDAMDVYGIRIEATPPQNAAFHGEHLYLNFNGTLTPTVSQWVAANVTIDTISAISSQIITMGVNGNGYEFGTYSGSLSLNSNDPENPSIEIPITMSVLYPIAEASVDELYFEESFNSVVYSDFEINNSGNYPLTVTGSLSHPYLSLEQDSLIIEPSSTDTVRVSFNSTLEEIEVSDNLILAYNDPFNSSDTVVITGKVVPDVRPIITSIDDVPSDQGGWVTVSFTRSSHDTDSLRVQEVYGVEIDDGSGWMASTTQIAYGESNYIALVPTINDSSDVSDGVINFRIIAGMEEGNFASDVVTGYSIDNIHPATPELTSAEHEDMDVSLNWQYELEEDFAYHRITSLNSTDNTISNEHSFTLNGHDEHWVNSVDDNGNYSDNTESIMSISLHAGANLKSFNVLPEDSSITNVMASIEGNVTGVIGEGVAANYMEGNGWMGSLSAIDPNSGYWIMVSEDDVLLLMGEPTQRDIAYNLGAGANLMSYPYRYPTPIAEALPEGIGCDISGIIGEGVATTCMNGNWMGSLSHLEGSYGYWFIAEEAMDITFNGCDEQECASLSRQSQNLSTVPDGFDYRQSTTQAFYFIEDIENIEVGDWILSFNDDVVIGARQWTGSIIDIPAMGRDGSDYTKGYMEAGSVPSFKILRGDELINLEGDIPSWENNQLYMVSSLTEAVALPETFSLDRAYPNPFNPTTTLSFAIPIDSEVSLSIYNLQGREVSTLIDGNMEAGYHSAVWDANSYASGVYFVKMVAGDFVNTQKLMLIK